LRGTGRAVKSLGDSDVSLQDISAVLGPRFDKNGWHYKLHTTPNVQRLVRDLYQRVFRRANVLNDTISLEFAHAVVVEAKDIKVNWTEYAVSVEKKQIALQRSRRARNEHLARVRVTSSSLLFLVGQTLIVASLSALTTQM
jgi:hypothetical protein